MRGVFVAVFLFLLVGCTGSDVNYMTATGKRPPTFFQVTDIKTMNTFVFDTKRFSFLLPLGKAIDFQGDRFWKGGSSRDGNTISIFNGPYHIDISTDYYPSKEKTQKAVALMNGTYRFHKKTTMKHKGSHTVGFINSHLEYHGKEHYPCLVSSTVVTYDKWGSTYKTGYSCYKLNPSKTKAQEVIISLTYSKPLDPKLAKIYTYQDLKHRAKRMLDSLYIKSWW